MTPEPDLEDPGSGLARERTELAWTRTAIAFAAIGGIILKSRPYAGIPILALSALIWQLGRLARPPGNARARSRHLLLIAVAITCVSFVALAITLLGPDPAGLRF